MFGAIPKTAWNRRYPADAQNGCILTMRVALIHTDDGRIILIDNGAGDKQLKQLSYYRFFDLRDLGEALWQRGVSREEVTDVVLTHLHFDHCGYTTYRHTAPDGTQTLRPWRRGGAVQIDVLAAGLFTESVFCFWVRRRRS